MPAATDVTRLIEAEIASESDSFRRDLSETLAGSGDYEQASAEKSIEMVSPDLAMVSGCDATMASYLKGAGYIVYHSGETAAVRRKVRATRKSSRGIRASIAAQSTKKGGGTVKTPHLELKFMTEPQDMNLLRRLFQGKVEGQSNRHFLAFARDVDEVIEKYRMLEGHDDSSGDEEPETQQLAPLDNHSAKDSLVASVEKPAPAPAPEPEPVIEEGAKVDG